MKYPVATTVPSRWQTFNKQLLNIWQNTYRVALVSDSCQSLTKLWCTPWVLWDIPISLPYIPLFCTHWNPKLRRNTSLVSDFCSSSSRRGNGNHPVYLQCSVRQWSSTRGNFATQGSGDIFGFYNWGRGALQHLASRVQRCCQTSYSTQNSPYSKELSSLKCQWCQGWEDTAAPSKSPNIGERPKTVNL